MIKTYNILHKFLPLFLSKTFILVLFLAFSFYKIGKTQNNIPSFDNFNVINGLAHNNVNDIYQDQRGFMWFGTDNGLSKYDGYEFTNYKNIPNNPNSLLDNHIIALTSDKNYNVWVLTMKGLSKLHLPTGKFTHFPAMESDTLCKSIRGIDQEGSRIYIDKQQRLWILCYHPKGNIMYLNTKTNTFVCVQSPNQESTSKNHTSHGDFWEDEHGNVHLGFARINIQTNNTEYLLYNPNINDTTQIIGIPTGHHEHIKKQKSFPKDYLVHIAGARGAATDQEGNIWIGDQEGQVVCYSPKTKRTYFYPQWTDEKNPKRHNAYATIKSVFIDKKKNLLYLGLYGAGEVMIVDLGIENNENKKITPDKFGRVVRYDFIKKEVWKYNALHTRGFRGRGSAVKIFIDNSECVWISIIGYGVHKYSPYRYKFQTFAPIPNDTNTLRSHQINGFYRTKAGNLFIATGGGLHEFIEKENRFVYHLLFFTAGGKKREIKDIRVIKEDNQGNLLVGTWGTGIYKYNPSTKQGYCLKHDKEKEEYNQAFAWSSDLWYDSEKNILWCFSWGWGVIGFIDIHTEKATTIEQVYEQRKNAGNPIPKDKMVVETLALSALRMPDGRFLVGGDREQPLKIFNPDNFYVEKNFYPSKSQHSDSLLSTTIYQLLQDKKGRIWAGTSNGLALFNVQKQTWKTYNTPQGIPNEIVSGILEDKDGFLWLLTGKGLAKFDADKEKVVHILESADGLPSDELLDGYVDNLGNLYIGTKRGFASFKVESLTYNQKKPKVILSKIELNENKLNVDSLLVLANKCVFQRHQNNIEISFASTDFNFTTKNKFKIKLEGYDSHWINHHTNHTATYTNLPAGNYTLKIQTTNNDGVWSEEMVIFTFRILPAWYETWWAMILFALLTIIFIGLVFRQRIVYLEQQQLKLEIKVNAQTKELSIKNEDLHQKNEEILQQQENLENVNNELQNNQMILERMYDDLMQKNTQIEQSFDAAERLQNAVLPTQYTLDSLFGKNNYFLLYKPQQGKVGGDFYFLGGKCIQDEYKNYQNYVYFACADCTGHGVEGAFMTMMGSQLMYDVIKEAKFTSPAKLLRKLHTEIRRTLQYETSKITNGMDLSFLIMQKSTTTPQENILCVSKIIFSGAKNDIYYITNQPNAKIQKAEADRKSIGGLEMQENEGIRDFTNYELPLENGKEYTIYLCSDGFQDQISVINKKTKKFGNKRLEQIITQYHTQTMESQKNIFWQKHLEWRTQDETEKEQDRFQTDDITLIGIKVKVMA